MSTGTTYYALTLNVQHSSTTAFYSLTPTSNLEISQGGVTCFPTTPAMTTVSIYPQTLQIAAPAGVLSAGVTIISSETRISGRVMISPPINVATVVTLYGNGGAQIGQVVVDPGSASGTFDFTVDAAQAISNADEARKIIDAKLDK